MHLWTSLAEFRQSKSCGCPIGIVMECERQEDKLHEFLTGIDEAIHGAVKSNLLSRDPLPSLDEAYNVLLQDEDSKKTYRIMDEKYENSAHAVRTGQYSTGSGNSGHSAGSGSSQQPYLTKEERMKQHCSSFGRNGHLASNEVSNHLDHRLEEAVVRRRRDLLHELIWCLLEVWYIRRYRLMKLQRVIELASLG